MSSPLDRRAKSLADALVLWYQAERRDLPWRRTRDPYAIWISEVMLQQTRVEVVRGRWERFLARFPDLPRLAGAPLEEVLAEWAGLGYYRRPRQLHAAARQVMAEHRGRLPSSSRLLRRLPGFGPYTAGAVASIAFGEAVPAVDGNVQRVIGRLLALPEDPRTAAGAKIVADTIRGLLRHGEPAILNQGLMELGAVRCLPRQPLCEGCPWSGECRAHELGNVEDYPPRRKRPSKVEVASYAAVHEVEGRFLLRRRSREAHNEGLWEFPTAPWHEGSPDAHRARRLLASLGRSLGLEWTLVEDLGTVHHTITRHRITLVPWRVEGDPVAASEDLRWVDPEGMKALGLTAAAARIRRLLAS